MLTHASSPSTDSWFGCKCTTCGRCMLETPGTLFVSLQDFAVHHKAGRKGARGWDLCASAAAFDNGNPVWSSGSGGHVAAFRVVAGDTGKKESSTGIRYSRQCAMRFDYSSVDMSEDIITPARGKYMIGDVGYFEIVSATDAGSQKGVQLVGRTQDAEGCRGACAAAQSKNGHDSSGRHHTICSSYTWRHADGACFLRSDLHWDPEVGNNAEGYTSGRPWHGFTGDNPAPWIDPESGEGHIFGVLNELILDFFFQK
eukprot:m.706270 g.706270  ORF g.706270 m.706270 type:complete len:256 (+) comp22931_c0_seq32:1741-2508(+)